MNRIRGQRAGWGVVAWWLLVSAPDPARGGWAKPLELAGASGQFLCALAKGSAALAAPALCQSLLQQRDSGAKLWTDEERAAAERRRNGVRRGLGFALVRNERGEWHAASPNAAARPRTPLNVPENCVSR